MIYGQKYIVRPEWAFQMAELLKQTDLGGGGSCYGLEFAIDGRVPLKIFRWTLNEVYYRDGILSQIITILFIRGYWFIYTYQQDNSIVLLHSSKSMACVVAGYITLSDEIGRRVRQRPINRNRWSSIALFEEGDDILQPFIRISICSMRHRY